jgi:acyl-CoA reductase-like NAD-dependent aldehyde dehydrogenase
MAEIASEFLPDGVLNVVTGRGSDIGEALLVHPGVDKVSFTGSTDIGRRVGEVTGRRLAHVSLELGGKSPNIVFADSATPQGVGKVVHAVSRRSMGRLVLRPLCRNAVAILGPPGTNVGRFRDPRVLCVRVAGRG